MLAKKTKKINNTDTTKLNSTRSNNPTNGIGNQSAFHTQQSTIDPMYGDTAQLLLQLQSTHGNTFVGRMINSGVLQRKCTNCHQEFTDIRSIGGTLQANSLCKNCQRETLIQSLQTSLWQKKSTGQAAKFAKGSSKLQTKLQGQIPVIQRAVTTSGGDWDTDRYDLVTPVNASDLRGVDIKLKFTPGNTVDAQLIGLTQSYKSIKNKKAYYINQDQFYKNRSISSGDAIVTDANTQETDEGSMIDRVKNYNNPIYPVQSTPSASLDDANTSPGWGQLGWNTSTKTPPKKDATLIDTPALLNAEKDSGQIFETTALATKGVQAGTYYGSVRWGWRTDSAGAFTKVPLQVASQGVPSSTFMKSAEIWNASQDSTGANTIDLPIVDVKVTSAPVTLMSQGNITLPIGTRVRIITQWHPPLLYGTIKVVDGPHVGVEGNVSYQDWNKISDERS